MIDWFHLLRRNLSYVLLMKTSSPVSKNHFVELICNFFIIWIID